MKRLFTLTLIAMLMAVSGSAQLIPKNVRYGHKAPVFKPQHEFRVGIGALPAKGGCYGREDDAVGPSSLVHEYNSSLINFGPTYETGAISLGYSYRAKRWLEFGVNTTFFSESQRITNSETGTLSSKNSRNYYAIMPMVRFSWLNRDIIRLYSEAALGLEFVDYKGRQPTYRNNENVMFAGQLTFVGISLGRKLFMYSELGAGTRGVFIIGGGYRFGAKKNNVSNVENFKR